MSGWLRSAAAPPSPHSPLSSLHPPTTLPATTLTPPHTCCSAALWMHLICINKWMDGVCYWRFAFFIFLPPHLNEFRTAWGVKIRGQTESLFAAVTLWFYARWRRRLCLRYFPSSLLPFFFYRKQILFLTFCTFCNVWFIISWIKFCPFVAPLFCCFFFPSSEVDEWWSRVGKNNLF